MSALRVGLDILKTTVNRATNKILAQLGNVVGNVAEHDDVEWIQHVGFYSVPSKAAAGEQAAQAVMIETGGRNVVIGSSDQRGLELAGNAKPGETGMYAAGEDGKAQGRVMAKADGSVNLFTTDTNEPGGQSVYLRVAPDALLFVAPWGTLRFDATGFHVLHESGARFDLGGIQGLPAPLDQLGSYVRMQAGTVNVSASAQSFGVGVHDALAKASVVLAALDALQAQITVQATAWAGLGALTGPILGVMVQPIAAPVAVVAGTLGGVVLATHTTIQASTSST